MALKLINKTKVRARNGRATIHLNRAGAFFFSAKLIELIGFEEGKCIEFFQDERRPKDWYFRISSTGIPLRRNKKYASAAVNSSYVANSILNSIGFEKSITIPVATEPIDGGYYAILTSML